jgi:hypothetical protein
MTREGTNFLRITEEFDALVIGLGELDDKVRKILARLSRIEDKIDQIIGETQ